MLVSFINLVTNLNGGNMTELQRELLIRWINAHTYSAESHHTEQGRCEWLRQDELLEFLPNSIEYILKYNKLP